MVQQSLPYATMVAGIYLHGARLLEGGAEEAGRLHVDAHGPEDDGEVVVVRVVHVLQLHQRRLPRDLRRHLFSVVWCCVEEDEGGVSEVGWLVIVGQLNHRSSTTTSSPKNNKKRERTYLVVGQAGGREDGDLLPARHRVHHVDRRDAGLDHGARVVAAGGVDGLPVDVEEGVGEHGRRAVDHLPGAVERANGEG